MRYVVELNGRRKVVSIEPDGVSFENAPPVRAELSDIEDSPVRVIRIGTYVYRVVARKKRGRGNYTLWVDGHRFETEALDERTRSIRDLSAKSAGPTGPAPILAPMPGMILRVNVKAGDTVEAGQGLVGMEARKMENELRATAAATVKNVLAVPGTAVEKGALLLEME